MIFIPFNVPSLKNSKTISMINKKPVLVPSKAVKKYLQKIGVKKYRTTLSKKQKAAGVLKVENYVKRPNLFIQAVGNYFDGCKKPVIVKFFFVRGTKGKFDFSNAVCIIEDLLTAHGFIEDDNMDCFIPIPMRVNGKWYSVDKENPGVYLKIMEII